MITRSASPGQIPSWQRELAEAIREPSALLSALNLPTELLGPAEAASQDFALRVPQSYLSRMESGNPDDPLLRQVLPRAEERLVMEGFGTDPVGDWQAMAVPGLIHKYHGRALLTLTGACGVHCRYCFRRHYPYSEANPTGDNFQISLDYLLAHPEISEVILSGGDPLSLSDSRLERLVVALDSIPHLRRLRWHSRLPVVIPSRVTATLLEIWRTSRLQQVLVLHFNHPNEINNEVIQYLKQASLTGTKLLNQSVLLRGINDDSRCLAELSEKLFSAGVLPYYLHLLDRTKGCAHFEVDDIRSQQIYAELQAKLPGYLVPKMVRDVAGMPSKQMINY